MWWLSISEIDFSVSRIRKKISHRKHVHHNPSIKYTSRCWEKRVAPCFVKQLKLFPEVRTIKVTHSAVELISFYPWVCSHHAFAVRHLILRCLTGYHMTILSKSNYRVRLNAYMDIADLISFYINFRKGYHFVLRLKQHFFDKARFF